ncbi:phospholipase D-like domain-containing protein [Roseibacillus persicicus]|uniref:phospholipase D-like domain-containing protein n=1 Tax=Roseibacillus persicicus TaxID=454148 RepID=UPI00281084CB|nr:phospholipase D-like domain-containing protein [Roseibacillus persicicus]MDQ8191105.1 phospholipase D-like domain-containing protein [Roseibacillus persicicus]
MTELLLNDQIYHRVIEGLVPDTQRYLWIVTADLKDLHVKKGRRYVPFLAVLSDLIEAGVAVRLFHAKEPGPRFRKDFDRYPALLESELFERILCPRIHTKAIVIDGKTALITSANLTGAGMGAKGPTRRNFEAGILTDEKEHLRPLIEWIDELYLGEPCLKCGRRDVCPDPIS